MIAISMLTAIVWTATPTASGGGVGDERFLALCYHDVVSRRGSDGRAVEETALVQQIEYLRGQGAHFLSVDELLAANEGRRALPPRSVLLTFDDGCRSFQRKALPILELYQVPAVLSVVTSWTEEVTGADCEGGVMSWKELAEVASHPLVEIGSHSHDFHRSFPINPLGSTAPAAGTRLYLQRAGRYESEAEYRRRLARDLELSAQVIERHLGKRPRVLTWPYGAYSAAGVEEATRAGYRVLLTIRDDLGGGVARVSGLREVPRRMLVGHPTVEQFARGYWLGGPQSGQLPSPTAQRAIHADLDILYDADPSVLRRNVDRFVDRVVSLKPSTVYLQAFADDSGSGNVAAVYFPNRVLPMKADLFSFVARALELRDIQVLAWMPALSLVLPDAAETEALRVRERHAGAVRPTLNAYRRLSPFSAQARKKAAMLFEDLGAASPLDGVLFQDDAFLDEDEDYHPEALAARARLGIGPEVDNRDLSAKQRQAWTSRKTRALIDWTDALMAGVRRHRPHARAVRTVYAPVLLEPQSERWFAQSYAASLAAYDEVVVMAYPLMENVETPLPWLRQLVEKARAAPQGLGKTVFKLQTVDWKKGEQCVSPAVLVLWMRTLLGEGARHLAYYPDNLFEDCPSRALIRDVISTEDFPLAPEGDTYR